MRQWTVPIYDGLKSYVNFTEGLGKFAGERIRFGNEEDGTSAFKQAYEKFQARQDKAQTRQILELARHNIHSQISQWQIIMII